MHESPPVTICLLTDFGTRDWYVAAMKGVLLTHCPQARLVDISHEVAPGDIASAAFTLSQCWQEFPMGTLFVAVVDPGVGTARKPLALIADGRLFIGPDNGLFGFLKNVEAREITNVAYFQQDASHTFHGRDVFAPAAAKLGLGASFSDVGPAVTPLAGEPWPAVEQLDRGLRGQVIAFDHFGNAITNLQREAVAAKYDIASLHVSLHPDRLPLAKTFGEVPAGSPLAYFGSGGYLELAVNGGNAQKTLSLHKGHTVEMLT